LIYKEVIKLGFNGRTMKDEIQDTTESIRGMKLGYHLLNYLLIDVITAQS
jgi:hypothetical protein